MPPTTLQASARGSASNKQVQKRAAKNSAAGKWLK